MDRLREKVQLFAFRLTEEVILSAGLHSSEEWHRFRVPAAMHPTEEHGDAPGSCGHSLKFIISQPPLY